MFGSSEIDTSPALTPSPRRSQNITSKISVEQPPDIRIQKRSFSWSVGLSQIGLNIVRIKCHHFSEEVNLAMSMNCGRA